MELRKGKTQEELLEALKTLSESLNIDSIAKPGQQVVVTGYRHRGKMRNWSLSLPGAAKANGGKRGNSYDTFVEALNQAENQEDINEFYILCLCQTELNRDWEGKRVSSWFKIDPYEPYQIKDNQPQFQIETLRLSDREHELMMDTGIAFLNADNGIMYPITKASIPYLGRVLPLVMEKEYSKLSVALMLATDLEDNEVIHMITGRTVGNVRPIRALAGRKYAYISQLDFFQAVFAEVSNRFDYTVHEWTVSDSKTVVDLYINPIFQGWMDSCKYGIRVINSDLPGTSMSVAAFVRFGNEMVILRKNSCEHTSTFEMEKDIPNLFKDISEAFDRFSEIWSSLDEVIVSYTPSLVQPILDTLGKKRTKSVCIADGSYLAQDLYKIILDKTYMELPEKTEVKLQNAYCRLLFDLKDVGKQKDQIA